MNRARPIGRVRWDGVLISVSAIMNSSQAELNVNMATVARAGTESGAISRVLSYVHLDRPSAYIAVYADGKTNLPTPPAAQNNSSWAGYVVDLAVRRYEVTGGVVEFDQRQLPVNLRGEDLRLAMNYEAAAKRYRGEVASRHLHMALSVATPAELDLAAAFTLEHDRLSFSQLHLASGRSRADLTGALTGLRAPSGEFRVKALVAARDAAALFSLPLQPTGSATARDALGPFKRDPHVRIGRQRERPRLGIRSRLDLTDATGSAADLVKVKVTNGGAE